MRAYLFFLLALPAALARAPPDYIVVGSGPGGCTVAARLCERLPHRRVVLLERGRAPTTSAERLLVESPRLAFEAQARFARPVQTEPSAGLFGRTLTQLTGNALGGLSVANGGQWIRAPLAQAAAWGFRGLGPRQAADLYARVERRVCPAVPPPALRQALAAAWSAAAARAALPRLRDAGDDGYNSTVAVTPRGFRVDACSVYAARARAGRCRHNLRIVTGAAVTRVLLSGARGGRRRARGVEYTLAGRRGKRRMRARREVIVAAGPEGSPQLLQLSGVGPVDALRAAGVAPLVDLPVGEGVRSRTITLVASAYTGVPTVPENVEQVVLSAAARRQFLTGRGGVLGKAISAMVARVKPGFLIEAGNLVPFADEQFKNQPLIISGCAGADSAPGSISLRSKDPSALPRLKYSYLVGPGDAARTAKCVQKLREVHKNLPAELAAAEVIPGPRVSNIDENYVRAAAIAAYHIVGGCAVGRVVDSEFRVLGIDRLRVVDASVIPTMPKQAGPMASVYMIAEHAADLITNKWKRSW